MKRPAVILTTLCLAACSPRGTEAPAPAEPAPAAAAPALTGTVSDFSQPMTARGTEPFWALVIEGTTFTLKRPDQPDLVFQAPGAVIEPGKATWVAKSADGVQLTTTLYVSECSDGMSDLKYPMTAEVALLNETLRGCAAKTADLAKAPPS